MKTLYEPANAIEAHMLRDLLAQEGIAVDIHGEHLTGAMGGLPAAGLVRLSVAEEEYERAHALIARWEAEQPAEPTGAVPPRHARRGWIGVVLGIVLGALATYAYFRVPVALAGIDADRDGRHEMLQSYSLAGTLVRAEADRNRDGKADLITHHGPDGQIESMDSDDDFDGRFETITEYRDGEPAFARTDADGDGYAERYLRYVDGVLRSREFIDKGTGRAVRVDDIRLDEVVRADLDTDHDGMLDTRVYFTPLGEVARREALPH